MSGRLKTIKENSLLRSDSDSDSDSDSVYSADGVSDSDDSRGSPRVDIQEIYEASRKAFDSTKALAEIQNREALAGFLEAVKTWTPEHCQAFMQEGENLINFNKRLEMLEPQEGQYYLNQFQVQYFGIKSHWLSGLVLGQDNPLNIEKELSTISSNRVFPSWDFDSTSPVQFDISNPIQNYCHLPLAYLSQCAEPPIELFDLVVQLFKEDLSQTETRVLETWKARLEKNPETLDRWFKSNERALTEIKHTVLSHTEFQRLISEVNSDASSLVFFDGPRAPLSLSRKIVSQIDTILAARAVQSGAEARVASGVSSVTAASAHDSPEP